MRPDAATVEHYSRHLDDPRLVELCTRWESDISGVAASGDLTPALAGRVREWYGNVRATYPSMSLVRQLVAWKGRGGQVWLQEETGKSKGEVSHWVAGTRPVPHDASLQLRRRYRGQVTIVRDDDPECIAAGYVGALNGLRSHLENPPRFPELTLEVWEYVLRAWTSGTWESAALDTDYPRLEAPFALFRDAVRALPWPDVRETPDSLVRYSIEGVHDLLGRLQSWRRVVCLALSAFTGTHHA